MSSLLHCWFNKLSHYSSPHQFSSARGVYVIPHAVSKETTPFHPPNACDMFQIGRNTDIARNNTPTAITTVKIGSIKPIRFFNA